MHRWGGAQTSTPPVQHWGKCTGQYLACSAHSHAAMPLGPGRGLWGSLARQAPSCRDTAASAWAVLRIQGCGVGSGRWWLSWGFQGVCCPANYLGMPPVSLCLKTFLLCLLGLWMPLDELDLSGQGSSRL